MSKTTLRTSLLLATLLAAGGFASAQTPPKGDGSDNKVKAEASTTMPAVSDKTRADVKADAKAANKALPTNKTGEGTDPAGKPVAAGDMKARADVKADAKMPLATGEGAEKGQNMVDKSKTAKKRMKKSDTMGMAPSSTDTGMPATRADVKAEAKAANKAQ